jgi:hypothetical protein
MDGGCKTPEECNLANKDAAEAEYQQDLADQRDEAEFENFERDHGLV